MRIIGGSCKGHPLTSPVGQDIRPTSDKVRGAMFNALFSRHAVVDAHVLDAFCGSGALGLEALSQGATSVVFRDVARTSLALAQDNARRLKLEHQCRFLAGDSSKIGAKPATEQAFSLIFLDPPYRKNLVPLTIAALETGGWIAAGALIVAETEIETHPEGWGDGYEVSFNKTYGETRVVFLQK